METDFRNDAPEGYFLTTGDHKKKTFQTEYELLESIGAGSFSEVKKCRHRHTGNDISVPKRYKIVKFTYSFGLHVLKSHALLLNSNKQFYIFSIRVGLSAIT